MKVLVTGGGGYIGSVVVSYLIQKGHSVVVLDKCLFGAESLLSFYGPHCKLISGDICDAGIVRQAMQGIDAIVHLAALVGEKACELDYEATLAINLHGTEQILHLAEESRVKRLIFVSTCSNYGVSSPDILADEEAVLRPLTTYAKTKVNAEMTVLQHQGLMTKTILRFGTICGLSPRMRFDLLVNDMARAVACDQPIQIFSPEAWRPFLHIQDSARVIQHCLSTLQDKIGNKVFNVVSENYQKKDLIELTHKYFPETVIEIIEKDIDPRDYRVNANRIKREIGFVPAYTIEQAYLEIFKAVRAGIFRNPFWHGYTSVPEVFTA